MKNHRFSIWLFALLCWFTVLGCNLLPTAPTPAPAPSPAVAKAIEPEHKQLPIRVSQFVFHSDIEMAKNEAIFTELGEMREQIFKDLRLPDSKTTPVQVHLFGDRDRYQKFMKAQYPDLPARRAFFAAKQKAKSLGGDELLVYTYWSNKINQDLRHEITHALLHSVLKGVPIWLDEGLAEYYEIKPGWNGVNYPHLNQLQLSIAAGQKLNMARLERLEKVHEVDQPEYREAWAWVHFMMHHSPQTKDVLTRYLKDLRTNPNPGPLRPRLAAAVPGLDSAVERYLANLEGNNGIQAASR